MYGQMTAGSWIYIGTQGILQGTYETFAELARQHFGGTLKEGKRPIVIGGLWGLGFGNDHAAGLHNVLYFTAGPDDEENAYFGKIEVA